MLNESCTVLSHTGGGGLWQGQIRLGDTEMGFTLETSDDEEDYLILRLSFVEKLAIEPPAHRWAPKKPTTRTSEFVIWYYSTRAGHYSLRKIEDYEASGTAPWFGDETDSSWDARLPKLKTLVEGITADLS